MAAMRGSWKKISKLASDLSADLHQMQVNENPNPTLFSSHKGHPPAALNVQLYDVCPSSFTLLYVVRAPSAKKLLQRQQD